MFVVPSQITANNKKDLKEALLALYSLAGHTNWIVVINKMDLVQHSEQGKMIVRSGPLECASKYLNRIQQYCRYCSKARA